MSPVNLITLLTIKTIILIIYLSNITNAALFSYVKRRVKRDTLDSLYSNERDDITIEIDPEEQERRLKEAQENCISKIINQSLLSMMVFLLIKTICLFINA